jgi:C-terminal processing protease CtpA/Prc
MPGPSLQIPVRPVAVLIDGGTAGAGESLAIAFAGRRDERFIGSPTSSGAESVLHRALPDGALLWIPRGLEEDRHGHLYPHGVQPDVNIKMDAAVPLAGDPAVHAAEVWLATVR